MAESAVSFFLDQISLLLREETKLLRGLEREVQFIRDEMRQINDFLQVVDGKDGSIPVPKEWIGLLRDIAYDFEDVLDKYKLRFRPLRGANELKKVCASIKNLKARHQIASEIKDIKYRLQNAFTSREKYRDLYANMDQGSSSTLPDKGCYDSRGDALFVDEDDVVGIEKPRKQLVEWINSMNDGLEVISVVGMGGLGKTTLVKNVYDDELVKSHFGHHIKIIASQYKDDREMLTSVIHKLVHEIKQPPPQGMESMSDGEMKEFIFNFLKKKNYIIVLDDVWNISKWDAIRPALPASGVHGCVIITTRNHDIAHGACIKTNHVFELQPLPEKEARELFYKKTFPKNPCPDYIRKYAEKMLKRCRGLPIAISVIGSLLATKDSSIEEWEMLERSLGNELNAGGDLEMFWKHVIALSYNDLPYFLKYCYLYLSIFPENSLLEKETIIRLWIAEGFVQPEQHKTMEEVALDYLNELLSRSLIQVVERHLDGRARAFRIHDLLRDYIVSKAGEDNIVTICYGGETHQPNRRIRRLAIQNSSIFSQDAYNLECLRSLLLLRCGDMEVDTINELVRRCRLLTVLELRGTSMETIPEEFFTLYYLRYLSLRSNMIRIIPKSIKYLVNLETLNLKGSYVTELPKEILKLHRLRHLLVYRYKCSPSISFDCEQSFKAPCGIGRSLPNLIKLYCVDANESDGMKMVSEIGELTKLRRLGVAKLRSEDGKELCTSLAKLTNLRSLTINSVDEDEKMDLDYPVSLPFLRLVQLQGCIGKVPKWVSCSNGLTVVKLNWCGLRDDPLDSLGDLPLLVKLDIHGAYFEGLRFKARGFKKLRELWLSDLEYMKWVIVEEGCMPCLEEWTLRGCKLMREVPQGMEHLPQLEILDFANMGDDFAERVVGEKRNEGVNWRLSHIPSIRFFSVTDYGVWKLDIEL